MASNFHKNIRLTVGLSSEHPEPFEEALRMYESAKKQDYQDNGGSFQIVPELRPYDQAYLDFKQNTKRYDIIMMDDIWVPEFAPSLAALETLRNDHRPIGRQWFMETFVNSLWFSCVDKEESTTIYGLPVLGNVELLLYRDNLINSPKATLPGNPDDLIDFLEKQARPGRPKPIALRYQSGNDSVEIFWNILRWYGYQDEVDGDEVKIPRRLAEKALLWMKRAQAISFENKEFGSKEIAKKLLHEDDLLMAFGWPGWVLREFLVPQEAAPSEVKTLYWPHRAVLGTWVFGIAKDSDHQEEALKVILGLATDPTLQGYLAQKGGVPTLRDFPRIPELRHHSFWQDNWPTVREAMESGRPRPRTPNWRKIEYDLGHQLKEGVLQDTPGFFRFTAD